jgi:2-deoxy-D-gluconate 3-dehydrogenase
MSTPPAQDGLSGEPARRFEGQRALVTGAASGIGRAVARRLGLEGAVVIGLDTQTDDLLEENLGSVPGVHLLTMDVCSEEAAAQAGAVDVLVNAAGILSRHALLEHPLDVWQRTLDVNLKAPLRLSREFARAHVEAGIPGAIVNVCSIESFVAGSDHAAYTASKSALLMATRAFALELAPHGIRVNAVAPGVTMTGMNSRVRADPERAAALTAAIPLGRMATPEEQAAGICFLASPDAGYITGATLPIDGGWLSR